MINRRQLITTGAAFIAAAHLPAMPTIGNTVAIEGKKLFIDEPIFVDVRAFPSFEINDCLLVFRGDGRFVFTDDDDVLSGKKAALEDCMIASQCITNVQYQTRPYIRNCVMLDERVSRPGHYDFSQLGHANLREILPEVPTNTMVFRDAGGFRVPPIDYDSIWADIRGKRDSIGWPRA